MAFDPQKDIPDLSGKVVLVTGGNRGLGAATIKFLVPHNPSIIYLCAQPASIPHAETLISSIKSSHPEAKIETIPLNLSSLDSVKQCAAAFNEKASRLDLLCLNAGISTTAPGLTDEGYESQFGVNYLGHALLTQLLMPKLLHTVDKDAGNNDVRILTTSSMAARLNPPETGLVLAQMMTPGPLNSYQRYAHSKLANILFARKLSQIYPSVTSVSFDPGQVNTDLFTKATAFPWFIRNYILPVFAWATGVSVDKGAESGLWALASRDVVNGAYYEPVGKIGDHYKYVTDQKLTDELWDWTNNELAEHEAPGWPES